MCDTGTCTKTSKFWIQSTVIEVSTFSCSAHLVKATRELTEMSRKATVSGNAPVGLFGVHVDSTSAIEHLLGESPVVTASQ